MSDSKEEPALTDKEREAQKETYSIDMLQEIEKLKSESREYKEKYLRALADMENARKRLQKEKHDLMRYAIEQVVCDLLQPLDNLENALRFAQEGSEEVQNWSRGFQMIHTQFKDSLHSHGVSAFVSKGEMFDPHLHEAVETTDDTHLPEGTIVDEFIRGYKLGDKTLRPARVKVAKKRKKHEGIEEKIHEENKGA